MRVENHVEADQEPVEESRYRAATRCAKIPRMKHFTNLQGEYLSFIYIYTRIHGRPPAEADVQRFFHVTPPAVHQMVLTLDKNRLISRAPGAPRSVKVLVPPRDLPLLAFLLAKSVSD